MSGVGHNSGGEAEARAIIEEMVELLADDVGIACPVCAEEGAHQDWCPLLRAEIYLRSAQIDEAIDAACSPEVRRLLELSRAPIVTATEEDERGVMRQISRPISEDLLRLISQLDQDLVGGEGE